MSFFTSSREKRLWFCSFLVLATIFSTLIIGQPLAKLLNNQDVQAAIFLMGTMLIGIAIIAYGVINKPGTIELVILLGIVAVYVLLFIRLGLPERSHLMEYSVLAISIHQSLTERVKQGKQIPFLNLLAFLITVAIGIIDELIQIFLPSRVFDINDILFNGFAAFMAIGATVGLQFIQKKRKI